MLDGLDLNPFDVLGLSKGCSVDDLREAYRKKSKKHHPDGGGDEWAFRVVVRAYEVATQTLERELLASRTREAPDTGRIRAGVQDKGIEPGRVVDVEMVWMRYEVDDVMGLLVEKLSGEDRNLSGSLEISWPAAQLADRAEDLPNSSKILGALNAAFDDLRLRTPTTGARSKIEDGKFWATLGYANGKVASDAFKHFHVNIKARGLGVKQWTRDVTIPRDDGT